MAVFTAVTPAQVSTLLGQLGLGPLVDLQGISAGIENTNYFVSTPQGEWVLTLFERLQPEQLPYYLGLMKHLADKGLPVPAPHPGSDGALWFWLAGKPAALVNKLPGAHQLAPDLHHCAQMGALMARMHLAVADFAPDQPNLRGLHWQQQMVPRLLPLLDDAQQTLVRDELDFQQHLMASAAYAELPRGAVHCDLFRDNLLFDGLPAHEVLTGCFDFYFAGQDAFAYDLAVCLNDWCLAGESGALDDSRTGAMVGAYQQVRPLTGNEQRLMPGLLRAGAFRFWLSRLADLHLPRDAELLAPKNPEHFEHVLRHRIANPWHPLQST